MKTHEKKNYVVIKSTQTPLETVTQPAPKNPNRASMWEGLQLEVYTECCTKPYAFERKVLSKAQTLPGHLMQEINVTGLDIIWLLALWLSDTWLMLVIHCVAPCTVLCNLLGHLWV